MTLSPSFLGENVILLEMLMMMADEETSSFAVAHTGITLAWFRVNDNVTVFLWRERDSTRDDDDGCEEGGWWRVVCCVCV